MLSVRRIVALVFLGCAVSNLAIPTTRADEGFPLEVSVDASYVSKYVWRGINLVDDSCFQPSVTVGAYGLSLNVWGSMELTNENTYPGYGDTAGDFTEVDYTLDYSFAITDMVGASVGVIYYTFPNTGFDSTTELYASVGVDCLLAPSLTVYRDIDEADGTMVVFGVGHTLYSFEGENVSGSLDVGANVAWGDDDMNTFYYGAGSGLAFADASVSLALDVYGVSVTPSINYARLIDSDIRDNFADDDEVWFGLSVGYSF